ncbi:AMP-binding protein [Bradyrhizobium sp. USDA 4469]
MATDLLSETLFARPAVLREDRSDGAILLRSIDPLEIDVTSVLDWLDHWAETTPNGTFLAEREVDGQGWRTLDFASLSDEARRIGAGLRSRGLEPGDRLAVLASNGIAHLKLAFGAYAAGIVYVPVTPQYAAPGADRARLRAVLDLVEPKAIYSDGSRLVRDGSWSIENLDILGDDRLHARATDPDAPAKILMTSGSTGTPKAVIQTQRTMTTNMAMTLHVWPFARRTPPIVCDWLPWNHAFGGNHILHMILACGGTLYVDDGFGKPERIAQSIRNLTEIRPTFFAAVPAHYAALLPYLEQNPSFRAAFFNRLDLLFSAGAAMDAGIWDRLRRASAGVRGVPLPISAGWGATELGPGATMVHAAMRTPASLGTPMPGVQVKLIPVGDKHELRVKSPAATPGYWRDPNRTAAAFDSEGYYRTGDAGLLADTTDPDAGLLFDGRLAEDFKLANGTWVNVARLRANLIAAGGTAIRDVVIVGADRSALAALFWLADGADGAAAQHAVTAHNRTAIGASTRIAAHLVLDPPPTADEVSDKGLIRLPILRERRAELIAALLASSSKEMT